jgi:hypothetical protein
VLLGVSYGSIVASIGLILMVSNCGRQFARYLFTTCTADCAERLPRSGISEYLNIGLFYLHEIHWNKY